MRKRFLILAIFAGTVGFVTHQTGDLILVYYLLSPLLLFPVFYFLKERAFVFLGVTLVTLAFFHGWFFSRDPHVRIGVLWAVQAALFSVLCVYLFALRRFFEQAYARKEEVRGSLENLQSKYQMRLSSLRHLEVQVGSLTNLFEIARDFSDCMDFGTLAEFLLKKLRPEITFQKMQIFLFFKAAASDGSRLAKVYDMGQEGVGVETRLLTDEEREDFRALTQNKTMARRADRWYFPILEGEELSAVFSMQGIREDDLARVEVLTAYLVLLIKKIKLYETVRELAIVDELTQVFVRHHFVERLEEELKRSIRFKLPMAVLMLDIDHFKRYNDDFGHLVGDATLKDVADLLRKNLRRVDLLGRYGGEEFVIAMPETKLANAAEVAERIRSNIARHDFQVYNDMTKVTVSQGLAIFDGESIADDGTLDTRAIAMDLIRQADDAMYKAKEEGRNRVCLYKDIKRS
ncbi:MAG TPA: GGDEF domain-containing protein [Candidatus Omnitrophota bacterium]|nr:GGDEF domain-containing protein [Candidatus Omnitrophota bacterium]